MIGFGSVAFGLGLVPILSWILVRLPYGVVVIFKGPDTCGTDTGIAGASDVWLYLTFFFRRRGSPTALVQQCMPLTWKVPTWHLYDEVRSNTARPCISAVQDIV